MSNEPGSSLSAPATLGVETLSAQVKPPNGSAQPAHGKSLRLERFLADSGFDAVIAVSPENVPYLSGVFIDTQRSIRDRLALVIWPGGGEPVLVVCNIEEPQARAESWIQDIRAYVEFQKTPIDVLTEVLHEKGLAGGRIGIELGYLSARDYLDLAGRLPRAELVACERVFDELRLVKTPEEVAALTHAAHATERALLAAFHAIEVGHSEKKMVASLACNLLENGAEAINFLYINAGPNTGYPHCKGTTYAAQRGDIVKSDVGGFFQGYVSDVARTGVIGPPTAEQRSIYARLMQVHRATIESAHAGRTAADVFRAAQAAYQAADLPFPLPHAGHSVGLTAHEWPVLSPRHEVALPVDSLFYIESRVRWIGREGYHVEDLVHITETGPRVITDLFNTEELSVI